MQLTDKETDYLACYSAWGDWMYFEAAESGYDHVAAGDAFKLYTERSAAYEERHGEKFQPSTQTATHLYQKRRAA